MNKIKIRYGGDITEFTSPQDISELTGKQWIDIVHNFIAVKEMNNHNVFALLISLLNIETKNAAKFIPEIIREGLFAFFQEQVFKILENQMDTHRWLIDELKVQNITLYGPRDGFSYMRFGEFISLDIMYSNYLYLKEAPTPTDYQYPTSPYEKQQRAEVLTAHILKTKHALNAFCAAIMRPQAEEYRHGSTADRRQEFHSDMIEARAELFTGANATTKLAILYNYGMVRKSIVLSYPLAFDASAEPETSTEVNPEQAAHSWLGLRSRLAGSVLNLEKIDNLLLSDVLSSIKPEQNENKA